MATPNQLILQTGEKIPIPSGQFFRTAEAGMFGSGPADYIYERTPQGIVAHGIRVQPDPSKPATQAISQQQFAALPQFSAGVVTDINRALGFQQNAQAITPEAIQRLGQISPLGNVSQQPFDAATLALVQQGRAGMQQNVPLTPAQQTQNQTALTAVPQQPSGGIQRLQGGVQPVGGVTAPNISDVSSLFQSAEIAAVEDKIERLSANLAAGLSVNASTQILGDLFERFGIGEQQSLVNQYNQTILEQQRRLRTLPDDIKKGLEDVGVTDSQLNRLIVKESQKPMELLRDLMEQKGVAQEAINQSLRFVGMFQDAAMQDRAAKLEAIKYEIETNKDLLDRLDDRQREFVNIALNEKKAIMQATQNAINAGATPEQVTLISASGSEAEALQRLGQIVGQQDTLEQVVVGGFQVLRDRATGKVIATKSVGGDGDTAGSQFEVGRQIIARNPDASDAQLKSLLLEGTNLNVTEVESLIATREQEPVTRENIVSTIVDVLTPQKELFTRKEARLQAENELKQSLGLKASEVLPDAFREAVEDALDQIYGGDATFSIIDVIRKQFSK